MMTDPPIDDTEAREPDAPDPTDAKHHAPLHGHTGAVPPYSLVPPDKEALSATPGPSRAACCGTAACTARRRTPCA
eukprot:scaffold11423_cov123-Isochrysis_galbana.AAC.4